MLERVEKRYGSEWRHDSFIFFLKVAQRSPRLLAEVRKRYASEDGSPVDVLGIRFPNRVGLAAGMDKNGEVAEALSAFGFGHIEIGTVTPLPQKGNPKPRVWRIPRYRSMANWLGFPNQGMEYAAKKLSAVESDIAVGTNLGKNEKTPLEEAATDYVKVMEELAPYASYFVINTSSPNTPGLRQLNQREPLSRLLAQVKESRGRLEEQGLNRPTLLKLSPDHTPEEYLQIIDTSLEFGIDGFIATNTTTSRDGLADYKNLPGGISGRLLTGRSFEVLQFLVKETDGSVPIISVGGIMGPDDAKIRIEEGAALVQVLTGFVYDRGIVKKINSKLAQNG